MKRTHRLAVALILLLVTAGCTSTGGTAPVTVTPAPVPTTEQPTATPMPETPNGGFEGRTDPGDPSAFRVNDDQNETTPLGGP